MALSNGFGNGELLQMQPVARLLPRQWPSETDFRRLGPILYIHHGTPASGFYKVFTSLLDSNDTFERSRKRNVSRASIAVSIPASGAEDDTKTAHYICTYHNGNLGDWSYRRDSRASFLLAFLRLEKEWANNLTSIQLVPPFLIGLIYRSGLNFEQCFPMLDGFSKAYLDPANYHNMNVWMSLVVDTDSYYHMQFTESLLNGDVRSSNNPHDPTYDPTVQSNASFSSKDAYEPGDDSQSHSTALTLESSQGGMPAELPTQYPYHSEDIYSEYQFANVEHHIVSHLRASGQSLSGLQKAEIMRNSGDGSEVSELETRSKALSHAPPANDSDCLNGFTLAASIYSVCSAITRYLAYHDPERLYNQKKEACRVCRRTSLHSPHINKGHIPNSEVQSGHMTAGGLYYRFVTIFNRGAIRQFDHPERTAFCSYLQQIQSNKRCAYCTILRNMFKIYDVVCKRDSILPKANIFPLQCERTPGSTCPTQGSSFIRPFELHTFVRMSLEYFRDVGPNIQYELRLRGAAWSSRKTYAVLAQTVDETLLRPHISPTIYHPAIDSSVKYHTFVFRGLSFIGRIYTTVTQIERLLQTFGLEHIPLEYRVAGNGKDITLMIAQRDKGYITRALFPLIHTSNHIDYNDRTYISTHHRVMTANFLEGTDHYIMLTMAWIRRMLFGSTHIASSSMLKPGHPLFYIYRYLPLLLQLFEHEELFAALQSPFKNQYALVTRTKYYISQRTRRVIEAQEKMAECLQEVFNQPQKTSPKRTELHFAVTNLMFYTCFHSFLLPFHDIVIVHKECLRAIWVQLASSKLLWTRHEVLGAILFEIQRKDPTHNSPLHTWYNERLDNIAKCKGAHQTTKKHTSCLNCQEYEISNYLPQWNSKQSCIPFPEPQFEHLEIPLDSATYYANSLFTGEFISNVRSTEKRQAAAIDGFIIVPSSTRLFYGLERCIHLLLFAYAADPMVDFQQRRQIMSCVHVYPLSHVIRPAKPPVEVTHQEIVITHNECRHPIEQVDPARVPILTDMYSNSMYWLEKYWFTGGNMKEFVCNSPKPNVPSSWLDWCFADVEKLYAFFMYAEALYYLPFNVADPKLDQPRTITYSETISRQTACITSIERAFRVHNIITMLHTPDHFYSGYTVNSSLSRNAAPKYCKYHEGVVLWHSPISSPSLSSGHMVKHQMILPFNHVDPHFFNLITFFPPHLAVSGLLQDQNNAEINNDHTKASEQNTITTTTTEETDKTTTTNKIATISPLSLYGLDQDSTAAQKRPVVPIERLNDK